MNASTRPAALAMKDTPRTDEQLVVPMTPAAAVTRLSQVIGALKRVPSIAAALPADTAAGLEANRSALLAAFEANDAANLVSNFRATQGQLNGLFEILRNADLGAADFAALGFPDPQQTGIQAIDPATVIATSVCPRGQVLTNISFQPAAGATGYWLYEVRYFEDQRIEDAIIGSMAPYFSRIRLAGGQRFLRIESRNPSSWVRSEEFEIQVPLPDAWD